MVESYKGRAQKAKNVRRAVPASEWAHHTKASSKKKKKDVHLERRYTGPPRRGDDWSWSDFYSTDWQQYYTAYRSVGSAITAMNVLNKRANEQFEYRLKEDIK